jgi:hypothetical protein
MSSIGGLLPIALRGRSSPDVNLKTADEATVARRLATSYRVSI